jgi:hypothetical protein
MSDFKGLGKYLPIIGAAVGIGSFVLAFINYRESKELRKIQKELAEIDLDLKKQQQDKLNTTA